MAFSNAQPKLKIGVMSGSPTIIPESELYPRIRCLIL